MDAFLKGFHEAIVKQQFNRININWGGCARAAYEFYKVLNKRPEFKIKGVKALSSNPESKTSIKKVAKRRQDPSMHFSHVVLIVAYKGEDYVIDADYGVVPIRQYYGTYFRRCSPMTGYISPKKLKQYCTDTSMWNLNFQTNNLKHIRRFLRSYDFNRTPQPRTELKMIEGFPISRNGKKVAITFTITKG